MTDEELRETIRRLHEAEAQHPHRVTHDDYLGSLTCACGRAFTYRTRGLALRYYREHREREVALATSFVACEHGHPERPAGESCGPCDDAFAAGLR